MSNRNDKTSGRQRFAAVGRLQHRDGWAEIVAPMCTIARAEFKVLGEPELRRLDHVIGRTTSHAARGVMYAKVGLLDEAEKEFQMHLRLLPADKGAKALLQRIQSWRH